MTTHSTTTSATKTASQPAGQRAPAPPWGRIIGWLLLITVLGLAAGRGRLLAWAAQQNTMDMPRLSLPRLAPIPVPQRTPPMTPTKPKPHTAPALATMGAKAGAAGGLVVRTLLTGRGWLMISGTGALLLLVIVLDLVCGAAALTAQSLRRSGRGRLSVCIRLPQPAQRTSGSTSDTDLLRALHRHLPTAGAAWGNAPALALRLCARPDEPVELFATVCGGTERQRHNGSAALRSAIHGMVPDAVIDVRPDPAGEPIEHAEHTAVWAEWLPTRGPQYPLRSHDDADSDLMGPLAAALRPLTGVIYTEFQLVLQPRLDDHDLARGWRANATRRLLSLTKKQEYALSPDAKALEAKLGGPVYHTTVRALAVAHGDETAAAEATIGGIDTVLGQYAQRTGSQLQRLSRTSSGRVVAQATVSRRRTFVQRAAMVGAFIGTTLLTTFGTARITMASTSVMGLYPLLSVPPVLLHHTPAALAALLPAGAGLLALVCVRLWCGAYKRQAVRALCALAPRAVPPGRFLWLFPCWRGPAILSPIELSGMWHLPTPALGNLVCWLPCRYLPPPPHAFVPPDAINADADVTERLIVGLGTHRDGSEAPVGMPFRDGRQGLAFTAPPGVGKTQLASNLADQFRTRGMFILDGKGDDAGNLVEFVLQLLTLRDEARLAVLDVRDTDWPIGLNVLAGLDMHDTGAVDQLLGQVEGIFGRLDPDTWARAPRMKNYLRKATLLVAYGETDATLAHVKQALLDETYRAQLVPHCANVEVRDFWANEFPRIGEQQRTSLDALISRFDMLLDSELTRYLFNASHPLWSFDDAIADRWLVFAPLAHRALGGLAGPVGMLLFQSFMRAAFRRPGSDQTRAEYGFIGDEFQIMVENGDVQDVRDALTQVRAFGIVTIIANQLQKQLGELAEYALSAISNRIVLRTQEPDASLYARQYAESGVSATDISGQEPRAHQYAWLTVNGQMTKLFSMRPLPWLKPRAVECPPYDGPAWQTVLPPTSPTPAFDGTLAALLYATHDDMDACAQRLADATAAQWDWLWTRWDVIRAYQHQYIVQHPGCITDRRERQQWLSRLRIARPRLLAVAEYKRIRRAIAPQAAPVKRGRNAPAQAAAAGTSNIHSISGITPADGAALPTPVQFPQPMLADVLAERGPRREAHDRAEGYDDLPGDTA